MLSLWFLCFLFLPHLPTLFHDNHITVNIGTAKSFTSLSQLLRLSHRGVFDRGYAEFGKMRIWPFWLVLIPARVLSMVIREIMAALWSPFKGPCVFSLLFISLPWRIWLRVSSITVQLLPTLHSYRQYSF